MFVYCGNNPVNCEDPDGYRPIWEKTYGGVTMYTDTALSAGGSSGTYGANTYNMMQFGVIIAGLEVIETGFGIVVITAITDWVDFRHIAGGAGEFAVGVVFVRGYLIAAFVHHVHHVLQCQLLAHDRVVRWGLNAIVGLACGGKETLSVSDFAELMQAAQNIYV